VVEYHLDLEKQMTVYTNVAVFIRTQHIHVLHNNINTNVFQYLVMFAT